MLSIARSLAKRIMPGEFSTSPTALEDAAGRTLMGYRLLHVLVSLDYLLCVDIPLEYSRAFAVQHTLGLTYPM